MSANDGGPAFPHADDHYGGNVDAGSHGMTLRDYFAAKAMAAMLGSESIMAHSNTLADAPDFHRATWLAEESYAFADAMIAEREAKP